jgi:hypothetical protein
MTPGWWVLPFAVIGGAIWMTAVLRLIGGL